MSGLSPFRVFQIEDTDGNIIMFSASRGNTAHEAKWQAVDEIMPMCSLHAPQKCRCNVADPPYSFWNTRDRIFNNLRAKLL